MHDPVCSLCKRKVRVGPVAWLRALSVCVALMLGGPALAASPACAEGAFRDFDFWLGSWWVLDAEGVELGRNEIVTAQQGCAVLEHWRSAQGSTGSSVNVYDSAAGQWRQLWVSPGTLIDIRGGLEDGSMVLTGSIVYLADGRSLPFRGTWTPLADGRVRQFFEEKRDDDEWHEWFEGFYEPIDDEPPED